jgi:hypothetical protein
MAQGKWHTRIERTPVDPDVKRLASEVAGAARWLSKVLAEDNDEVELEALKEYLRQVLLRLEESSTEGRLLR